MQIEVPMASLDAVVSQFHSCKNGSTFINEYDYSSRINRYLDRFYFSDSQVHEGAVLSQYPLEDTRRGYSCIVHYSSDDKWNIKHPVFATNDTKLSEDKMPIAQRESLLYSVCGVTMSDQKYPYFFHFHVRVVGLN